MDRNGKWYIVDGRYIASTKTEDEEVARHILERYVKDRLGILDPLKLQSSAKEVFKKFGSADIVTAIRKLRFPCVYAFIRDGEIVYVGSSINGFARVMQSHHPMLESALEEDKIAFWVTGGEIEARELEHEIIKMVKPKFNGNGIGKGYGQRT